MVIAYRISFIVSLVILDPRSEWRDIYRQRVMRDVESAGIDLVLWSRLVAKRPTVPLTSASLKGWQTSFSFLVSWLAPKMPKLAMYRLFAR